MDFLSFSSHLNTSFQEIIKLIAHENFLHLNHDVRHSVMFQISLAYCAIVRSLLNFPLPAVLNIDIFSHFFRSLTGDIHRNNIRYNIRIYKNIEYHKDSQDTRTKQQLEIIRVRVLF